MKIAELKIPLGSFLHPPLRYSSPVWVSWLIPAAEMTNQEKRYFSLRSIYLALNFPGIQSKPPCPAEHRGHFSPGQAKSALCAPPTQTVLTTAWATQAVQTIQTSDEGTMQEPSLGNNLSLPHLLLRSSPHWFYLSALFYLWHGLTAQRTNLVPQQKMWFSNSH